MDAVERFAAEARLFRDWAALLPIHWGDHATTAIRSPWAWLAANSQDHLTTGVLLAHAIRPNGVPLGGRQLL